MTSDAPLPPVDAVQLAAIAERLHLGLAPAEIALYRDLVDGTLGLYRGLAALPDTPMTVPNRVWAVPAAADNPLNAWYVTSRISGCVGEGRGPLAGRTIAIKDNIGVAGLPMMNGVATLKDHVADTDATVVTRILAAGGTITGKAHCEAYCLSCSSFTNATGPVRNPHDPARAAGGSSSGSAALVAAGLADMALGTDQGGSVRMPSSYCGTYGLKPSFGLVPYTGAMAMEVSVDHIGPITRTVEDNALLLDAIAGDDGSDPRQRGEPGKAWRQQLSDAIAGVRIGVLGEGFGHANSDPDVDAQVRSGAARLADRGAILEPVSIPEHLAAPLLWFPLVTAGAAYSLLTGGGHGLDGNDYHSLSLVRGQLRWVDSAADWPVTVKVFALAGAIASDALGPLPYARAANLRRPLRAAINRALSRVDLLLMPTTPHAAPPLPAGGDDYEQFGYATRAAANTLPFNLSGHPAISLPCATIGGLPVGMMLVARHGDEAMLFRAALAFQNGWDWTRL